VAILFTDVVGSTELSQLVSADAADEVRRGHFAIVRQALGKAGGSEVKNLGDGLMVMLAAAPACRCRAWRGSRRRPPLRAGLARCACVVR
jgi:class 3 adenylate cyclase